LNEVVSVPAPLTLLSAKWKCGLPRPGGGQGWRGCQHEAGERRDEYHHDASHRHSPLHFANCTGKKCQVITSRLLSIQGTNDDDRSARPEA